MAATAYTYLYATPFPLDDHFQYQRFIESLASGVFDTTIPGFHGSDIFAVPWYLISNSSIAQIDLLRVWGILLPLFAFLAVRSLFRSNWEAVIFAGIIALMPFLNFVSLRGWTGPAFMGLLLLTIFFATKKSPWTGVFFGLALLTKPFALALLPLLIVLAPKGKHWWKRYRFIIIGVAIAAAYLLAQYLQAGRLIIGAHSTLDQLNVWQGPDRIILNIAHSFQILFSIHNYYYPDPALTGPGNMMHTTPILVLLGLFGVLCMKKLYRKNIAVALLLGAIIGLGLNALLDHMDHFYMEAGILMLILAALPVLKKYPIWIPFVLATLHFQWLYFFLQFKDNFQLGLFFFAVPIVVDALFILWCIVNRRDVSAMIRSILTSFDSQSG